MGGPIARLPRGLLDLLLTQQQGKNPDALGDTLAPVIDLAPFYEQERFDAENLNATMTAVGVAGTFTVPAGEAWKVLGMSVRGTFATVNQTIGVQCRILNLPNVPAFVIDQFDFAAVGATDTFGASIRQFGNIIFPAGLQFRFQCSQLTLDGQPSIAVTGSIWYVRLEV